MASVYQGIALLLLVAVVYKFKIPVPCYGCDDLNGMFFKCMSGTGTGTKTCDVIMEGERVIDDVEARIGEAIGFSKRVVAFLLKDIPNAVVGKIIEIRDYLLRMRDDVLERLMNFKNYMMTQLQFLRDQITKGLSESWDAVRENVLLPIINGFMQYIMQPITTVIKAILQLKEEITARIADGWTMLTSLNFGFITDLISEAWGNVTGVFDNLDGIISNSINEITAGVMRGTQESLNVLAGVTQTVVSGVVTGVEITTNGLIRGVNEAGSVIEDAVTGITRGTEAAVKGVIQAAEDGVKGVVGGLNSTLIPGLETVMNGFLRGLHETVNVGIIDNLVSKPVNGILSVLREFVGFRIKIDLFDPIPPVNFKPFGDAADKIPGNVTIPKAPLCDDPANNKCKTIPRIPTNGLDLTRKVDINLCPPKGNGKCIDIKDIDPVTLSTVTITAPTLPDAPKITFKPFKELGNRLDEINPYNMIRSKLVAIKNMLKENLNYILSPIKSLIATVLAFKDTIVVAVAEFMRLYLNPARLMEFIGKAKTIIMGKVDRLRELFVDKIIDPLLAFFGYIKQAVVNAMDWIKIRIMAIFQTVVTAIRERFGRIVTMVSEIVTMVAKGVAGALYFGVGTAIDKVTYFIPLNVTYKVFIVLLLIVSILFPTVVQIGGKALWYTFRISLLLLATALRTSLEYTDMILPDLAFRT